MRGGRSLQERFEIIRQMITAALWATQPNFRRHGHCDGHDHSRSYNALSHRHSRATTTSHIYQEKQTMRHCILQIRRFRPYIRLHLCTGSHTVVYKATNLILDAA